MHNKPSKKILNILLFLLFSGSFFAFGYYWGDKKDTAESNAIANFINLGGEKEEDLDLDLFWKVYKLVDNKYIDENIDRETLVYGAIEGMVDSLGDVHSYFMDPEKTQKFEESLDSVYEGIGAYVGIRDDVLTIISPLKNSPAEKAGVHAGDKIIQINDVMTDSISLDEAIAMLKGEKGTTVKVILLRGSNREVIEAEIVRDVVNVPSVEWEKDDNIALLKINKFEKGTSEDVTKVLDEIKADSEINKLILDVRDNPGGYFNESISLVGLFVGKDKVAVIEEKRDGDKTVFETETESDFKDWPMVVLVNGSSASASEILAGALRDHRNIKLIGSKTYGKGSVQEYNNQVGEGSSLKMTIARWLTPNEIQIDGQGLEPDVVVENTPENVNNDQDPQYDKAKEEVQKIGN